MPVIQILVKYYFLRGKIAPQELYFTLSLTEINLRAMDPVRWTFCTDIRISSTRSSRGFKTFSRAIMLGHDVNLHAVRVY